MGGRLSGNLSPLRGSLFYAIRNPGLRAGLRSFAATRLNKDAAVAAAFAAARLNKEAAFAVFMVG
jgi:hypothetical protein